jgi:hypothetical protein
MIEGLTFKLALAWLRKNWLPIVILVAIVAGLWFVDHRGFERAKAEDKARQLERQEITRAVVSAIDGELDRKLATIADQTHAKIQTIDTEGKTVVQPIIEREILRDRGLSDPNRCLSPGLLAAINAARGYLDEQLAGAEAGSGNAATVPAAGARH